MVAAAAGDRSHQPTQRVVHKEEGNNSLQLLPAPGPEPASCIISAHYLRYVCT